MNYKTYLKTNEGNARERYITRIIVLVLAACCLMMSLIVFNKDQIVVMTPETLKKSAWVSSNDSSREFKESWAMFMAHFTGNVTPENIDFIKKRVGDLLAPQIYNSVITSFEDQALHIRQDNVSMTFEPRSVEYEAATNKTFVTGTATTRGALGNEKTATMTYEYVIETDNYRPLITSITNYEGSPKRLTPQN